MRIQRASKYPYSVLLMAVLTAVSFFIGWVMAEEERRDNTQKVEAPTEKQASKDPPRFLVGTYKFSYGQCQFAVDLRK